MKYLYRNFFCNCYKHLSLLILLCSTQVNISCKGNFDLQRYAYIPKTVYSTEIVTINNIPGPKSNTPITVLQAPGAKLFFCDLTQTSISTSDVAVTIKIQNRFGSRFSNSHLGSLFMAIFAVLIDQKLSSSWNTYLTNNSVSDSSKTIVATSGGIGISLVVPAANIMKAIDALAKISKDIQEMTISDSEISSAIQTTIYNMENFGFKTSSSNSVTTNVHERCLISCCAPQMDSTITGTGYTLSSIGLVPGGALFYDKSRLNDINTQDLQNAQSNIHNLHTLIKLERSFLIFIASSNATVKTKLEDAIGYFCNKTNAIHCPSLNDFYSGFTLPKGTKHIFSYGDGTNIGAGGSISIGDINKNTLLAAGIFAYVSLNSILSSGTPYTGYLGINLLPIGGKIVVSGSSNVISNIQQEIDAWKNHVSAIRSRYTNNSNSSDFSSSGFLTIIDEVIGHFTPGSNNSKFTDSEVGIYGLYNDNPSAYTQWMEMFYGAFNVIEELRTLSSDTDSNKTEALKDAAKVLVDECYESNTFSIQIN